MALLAISSARYNPTRDYHIAQRDRIVHAIRKNGGTIDEEAAIALIEDLITPFQKQRGGARAMVNYLVKQVGLLKRIEP